VEPEPGCPFRCAGMGEDPSCGMRDDRQSAWKPAGMGRRISVAMATFNGEKYIGEQLDSIARQQMLPTELVITDDGSTDGTLEVVEAFACRAPFPVRVFRNESRLGYAENFLKAASLCEGDLIAFCDQDDIWLEQKLRICSEHFEDAEVVLVVHSSQKIGISGETGRYPRLETRVWKPNANDPFATLPGFAMVLRRDLITLVDSKLRPSRLHGHDHWLWFLAVCSARVVTIAAPLALYRQHGGNVFGAPRQRSLAKRVESVATTLGYDEFSDAELMAANLLSMAAEEWPRLSEQLRRSARLLTFRSRLHRLRTQIYERGSNFPGRAIGFVRISLMSGYWPDRSNTRLGMRAALKDMFFGVPGIYKLLLPTSKPREER
jgi:rhamnosyltransferase